MLLVSRLWFNLVSRKQPPLIVSKLLFFTLLGQAFAINLSKSYQSLSDHYSMAWHGLKISFDHIYVQIIPNGLEISENHDLIHNLHIDEYQDHHFNSYINNDSNYSRTFMPPLYCNAEEWEYYKLLLKAK